MNEYKNIEKIKPETLLDLMREVLDQADDFSYITGSQPFFMSFHDQKYYVYVKNISSAYFSDRDKTTRAQLPIKPEFDSIKSSPYPFIFLGYDNLNDVFVCWNYYVAKERLNVGKSVSFYSRTFFQSEVNEGEFIRRKLKNGDFPVLFKRSYLIEFFNKIDTFFSPPSISNIDYAMSIGDYNYEEQFKIYLKQNRFLSEKSVKNYISALKGMISEGVRKHFIPTLISIFYVDNISILEKLNSNLFDKIEYSERNIKGKNMYSCAFDNYIEFIKKSEKLTDINVNNSATKSYDENVKNGKLVKIVDQDLLNKIDPYIKSNRILSAAQIIGNHYQNQFSNMELSDWINLVKNI